MNPSAQQPSPAQLGQGAPTGTQTTQLPQGSLPELLGALIPLRNPLITGGKARPLATPLPTATLNSAGTLPVTLQNVGLGLALSVHVSGSFVVDLAASTTAGSNGGGIQFGPAFPFDIFPEISFQPSAGTARVSASARLLNEEMSRMFGKVRNPNFVGKNRAADYDAIGTVQTFVPNNWAAYYTIGAGAPVTITPGMVVYNTTTAVETMTITYSFDLLIPWVDNLVDFNGLIPLAAQNASFAVNFTVAAAVGTGYNPAQFVSGADITGASSLTSQTVSIYPTQEGITVPDNPALYVPLSANIINRVTVPAPSVGTGLQAVVLTFPQGYVYKAAILDLRLGYLPDSGDVTEIDLNITPNTPTQRYTLAKYVERYTRINGAPPTQGIFLWDADDEGFVPGMSDAFAEVNAQPGGVINPNVTLQIAGNAVFGSNPSSNRCTALLVSGVVV